MGDWALIVAGALLLAAGLAGCLLPVLPGPPLAYAGLVALHLTQRAELSHAQLAAGLLLVLAAWALDAAIPALGAKRWGGTRWGVWGCLIGAFVGVFLLPPLGFVLGSFAGAVAGELLGGKSGSGALLAGLGALMGFLLGTVLKLALCGVFAYWFAAALLHPSVAR
jgi:uncharacterized protein YqgC (DUF456 family)